MKASDLRIGNLVGIKKTALHAGGCNIENAFFEIEELKKDIVQFKDFHAGEYYKDLKGIEITENILTDLNFKKYDNGSHWKDLLTHYLELFYINGYWYPIYTQFGEMRFEEDQMINLNGIEFVHELQNLYFVLLGNEIDVSSLKQNT